MISLLTTMISQRKMENMVIFELDMGQIERLPFFRGFGKLVRSMGTAMARKSGAIRSRTSDFSTGCPGIVSCL